MSGGRQIRTVAEYVESLVRCVERQERRIEALEAALDAAVAEADRWRTVAQKLTAEVQS